MKLDEALSAMTSLVEEQSKRFIGLGVTAKIETDLMDRALGSVTSPKKARFVTVTLVLSAEGITEGEEYCLSLGAEIKGSKVNETIAKDMDSFVNMVDEALEQLSSYENKAEGIKALATAASREFDELVDKIKGESKKQKITGLISVLAIIAIFALFIFITMTGGK